MLSHDTPMRTSDVRTSCEHCGAVFFARRFQVTNGTRRYCSPTCKYAAAKKRNAEAPPSGVLVTCQRCGQEFRVKPYRARSGQAQYCSMRCKGEAQRRERTTTTRTSDVPRTCEQCGKEFMAHLYQLAAGQGRFCGQKCASDHKRRGWVNKDGYIMITVNGETHMQHRLIMSQHLGRPLRKDEHVHHINGVRADNRIENLAVMDAGEHVSMHKRRRQRGSC